MTPRAEDPGPDAEQVLAIGAALLLELNETFGAGRIGYVFRELPASRRAPLPTNGRDERVRSR